MTRSLGGQYAGGAALTCSEFDSDCVSTMCTPSTFAADAGVTPIASAPVSASIAPAIATRRAAVL
jgi:hypothetical protein